MKHKVYILGDTGLLGLSFIKYFKNKKFQLVTNSSMLKKRPNFEDIKTVFEILNKVKPNFILNFSGATNVDECEENKNFAKKNYTIPSNLREWQKTSLDTKIIHISTDQVYGGKGPHYEKKATPLNIYGLTKKRGEEFFSKKNTCILRTNFFGYSINENSFSDWIYNSIKKNKKIKLFRNIKFNPLSISKLCSIIKTLIIKKFQPGIYNLGSKNGFSKSKFAILFIKNICPEYKNYEVVDFEQTFAAKRNCDMRMNVTKFQKKFKINLPTLTKEIFYEIKKYKKINLKIKN